ncbi:MAG: helix-turn-helix transcriptional regulator, partial [Acidobacteriota bacterium]
AFFILFALANGDKHGYAIMRETRDLSEGDFELGPATLYTTIQRLLESGWIAEVKGPDSSDARRRYYGLTKQGSDILDLELKRMESMVRKSKALRLRGAEPVS